jgi:protease-4
MVKIRFPFLVLAGLSAAVAVALLLAGAGGGRRALKAPGFPARKVAVVELSGVMTSSHDAGDRAFSARRVVELIEKYRDDDTVRAVVLRVDSPGGTVVAAQEIHRALQRLRESAGKKVLVSMGDLAASGGYYVACAADRVFASPGTLTGSIGVIMQFPNYQGLLGKIGLGTNTIKSGEFKDLGNGAREMTERDRRLLQGLVDDVYAQFVEAVAAGRGMSPEKVRPLADGRVFSGRQALALGLVDELGDLDAAIAAAGRLAGIAGTPEVLREKPKRRIWELLDARFSAIFPATVFPDAAFGQARLLYLWQ